VVDEAEGDEGGGFGAEDVVMELHAVGVEGLEVGFFFEGEAFFGADGEDQAVGEFFLGPSLVEGEG